MSKKITLTVLKDHLKNLSKPQLEKEISFLFKTYPSVKEYYNANLGNENEVMEDYREQIVSEFSPTALVEYPKFRISKAKKALSDFKKISKSPENIAELMVSYVEAGVVGTNMFGDIDEPFYDSMTSMYERTYKFIIKEGLLPLFSERLAEIVSNTEGIGWGFHDMLSDIHCEYNKAMKQMGESTNVE